MSLVHKKLIDWILSILLLPDSGALKDPNIFKIIQSTCMTTNLGNFSYKTWSNNISKLRRPVRQFSRYHGNRGFNSLISQYLPFVPYNMIGSIYFKVTYWILCPNKFKLFDIFIITVNLIQAFWWLNSPFAHLP